MHKIKIKDEIEYSKLLEEWGKIIEKAYNQFSDNNYKEIWQKKNYKNKL